MIRRTNFGQVASGVAVIDNYAIPAHDPDTPTRSQIAFLAEAPHDRIGGRARAEPADLRSSGVRLLDQSAVERAPLLALEEQEHCETRDHQQDGDDDRPVD